MAWVRLDDKFPEHPKVDAAGGDAGWLHVCAIAYCNRNETDGFIARERLVRLSDRRSPKRLAATLVGVGLWEIVDGGWVIHDYLEYQPSRASLAEQREAAKERMRVSRNRSANVRPNKSRTNGEVRETFESCSPYPVPDPVPVEERITSERSSPPTDTPVDIHRRRTRTDPCAITDILATGRVMGDK